jgi:hypothetical protein
MISYSPRQCYYKKWHVGMILLEIRQKQACASVPLNALAITKTASSCIVFQSENSIRREPVESCKLRFSTRLRFLTIRVNLAVGHGVAIREFPMKPGFGLNKSVCHLHCCHLANLV